jgi:hypothetical protein
MRAEAEAVADGTGAFAHDFTEAYDVRHRDRVQLEVRPGGHRVTAAVPVAGLELDLDAATLTGALTPDARLVARLQRGGRPVAEASGRAAEDGTFALRLVGAGGAAPAIAPGDVVEVLDAAPGGESLRLTVPELAIDAAAGDAAIRGRATPGGTLAVLATAAAGADLDGGIGQAWPAIGDDGRWSAELVPTMAVAPGHVLVGQYQLPAGHVVRRTAYVPLLLVDHGGARACGVAKPGEALAARLEAAGGAVRATGAGSPEPDGRFGLPLRDQGGTPVATRGGDVVEADLGGIDVSLTLPPLEARYDPATGRVTGTGDPGAPFRVSYPARPCTGPYE